MKIISRENKTNAENEAIIHCVMENGSEWDYFVETGEWVQQALTTAELETSFNLKDVQDNSNEASTPIR